MQDRPTARTKAPSAALAGFAASLTWDDIPDAVIERAKLLILDALGVGIAATTQPFAGPAVAGVEALGQMGGGAGLCSVIGRDGGLSPRDAALANGMLIHGLDFDDTHLASIVHASAACLPAALAMAESCGASGRDMLVAYAAGMETAIRVGMAADGRFHHAGFHATAIAAHFSSALIAAKLLGLDAEKMTMAQGIAGSTAAGIQVFLEEGAWTKRFHPGWAASAGITAAMLAGHGFVGPSRPYEGKFGLFQTHFQAHNDGVDLGKLSAGLGRDWMLVDTAIKPYPVCHFIHGCADAALALRTEIGGTEITAIEAFLPEPTLPIVAEPTSKKLVPKTDYDAKFSAQFVVATCLARGRFGLAELEPAVLADAALLALAAKVTCHIDPDTAFPEFFSGGLTVRLADGRVLNRHVRVNSGAGERALDVDGVSAKFRASAGMAVDSGRAERIRDIVLSLERHSGRDLGAALRLNEPRDSSSQKQGEM